ncbi:hypothetical protein M5689_019738 [Euphorbia peplus]|nr:hypothetical protein M5689_019738 [Euphorbia peplus]
MVRLRDKDIVSSSCSLMLSHLDAFCDVVCGCHCSIKQAGYGGYLYPGLYRTSFGHLSSGSLELAVEINYYFVDSCIYMRVYHRHVWWLAESSGNFLKM